MERVLDNDVKFVAGVGEARARLLDRELGIRTVGDLLGHYPYRYIDRTKVYRIADITEAAGLSLVQFRARVTGVAYAGEGRRRRFTVFVSDASGSAELVWFHGIAWIEKRIEQGREYLVFGRPSFYRGSLSVVHPDIETMEQALTRHAESGMQGIYPSTEKLSSVLGAKGFHRIVTSAWELVRNRIDDPLPEALRRRLELVPLSEALHGIHFPQSAEGLEQARRRLKFDELLGIQLNIQARRTDRLARRDGFLFPRVGPLFRAFYETQLPFPLTGAQKRVIREIREDTVTGHQMNRLLQGDVGSGKTLVALMSMLLAVDNGYQACLMGGVEVAYELKDCCDYLVSSSAEILAAGFPYKEVSGYLLDGSLSSLKAMSDEYYRTYINDGATVSVVETKALDALASSVRTVLESGGADSIPELDMDSLQGYFRRLWNGHSYYEPHWFYDLGDFISHIAPDEASLDAFQTAIESAVVYRRSTENFVLGNRVQFPIKTFSGLSTYVPNPENSYLDDYYRTLAWNQAVRMVR